MDPLTHALASFTLQRAAFPRLSRSATIAVVLAGTTADVDLCSTYFGPSAYLSFHRTYFHSLLAALVFSLLVTVLFFFLKPKNPERQISRATIFAAALAVALLHPILDLCQTAGVELLWPFSSHRFALDWLPSLDLWVLGILLAGILLPLLSGLVTEEIGARRKGPRGRLGATLASVALILYLGVRVVFHGDAIPALDAARNSSVASRFLQLARFPKATVEQTSTGFHVILRAFPYSRDSGLRVQALIDTDPSGKILSGELAWISSSHDFP